MKKSKEDRLSELRILIREHDDRYYRDANPVIGDREYDSLKKELEGLELELDLWACSRPRRHHGVLKRRVYRKSEMIDSKRLPRIDICFPC